MTFILPPLQEENGVPGLDAIWTPLKSAVLDNFGPYSPYGAPALGGALLFSALYYIDCRKARERRVSVRGFVRTIFARRVILHPSSLVDVRMWVLNGIVFASSYGLLGLGLFFWRDQIDSALIGVFGARAPTHWPAWAVMTMATALMATAAGIDHSRTTFQARTTRTRQKPIRAK